MTKMNRKISTLILSLFALPALLLVGCGDDRISHVILETSHGNIEIAIYNEKAPISAADFLYYVDNGLYDGEGFYRAVRPQTDPRGLNMEIIQGGLLGMETVTATIEHETTQVTGLSHTDGAISIARDEPGTGSAAYFFISIGDNTELDFGGERNPDGQGYAVFGKVIKGMDVVRAIQMSDTGAISDDAITQGQMLTKPVIIVKAKRK
ncbi:MAG: peptidylprolyl isomerase [Robiginitomaculum sp.]|nr:MAG: peptidylprolyl isomerase [Robiginitomaculum sp.]